MTIPPDELTRSLRESLRNRAGESGLAKMAEHASAPDAIRWGCRCGWAMWRPQPPVWADTALEIANRWCWDPQDGHRIRAARLADRPEAGVTRWLLQALVFSGGTLRFPDEPADRPTPDSAAKFVAGFVQHLLALAPPADRPRQTEMFVELACQTLEESPGLAGRCEP